MTFSLTYLFSRMVSFAQFIPVTLAMTIIAAGLGMAIGLGITMLDYYKVPILRPMSKVYVSFFRGVPLLVQLFIFYYGLPQIFPSLGVLTAFAAACLTLGLNAGAYMSEAMRGAISAIDKGQMEACLSVGMTSSMGMRRIILPQAARIALPALGNNFMGLMKETSLAFVLGVSELLAAAKMSAAASYKFFENYLAVGLIYWILIIALTYGLKYLENRLSVSR